MMTEEYLALLKEKHATDPTWGSTSVRYVDCVTELVRAHSCATVLDYGCGKGALLEALGRSLPELVLTGYDPAIPKFSKLPEGEVFDLVICTDVMEHVEEKFVAAVLANVAAMAGTVAYFLIACYPARHFLPDGRNAHLTVRSPEWWHHKLETIWPEEGRMYSRNTATEFEALTLTKGI